MSLQTSIVVVNEFSVPGVGKPTAKGASGSRGSTPGDYVLRYMARKGATEPLTPIRRTDHEAFIRRYMAREGAVERLRDEQFPALERELSQTQGLGGVAFGYGSFALSDEALASSARDVQRLFDSGHTVMKTVLSFDEQYLRAHKLIPEDFTPRKAGDYRGQLDQLKLRLAIMRGLVRMGRACYDDLRYVGVIQIDTKHVHCHLAMVDAGQGRLAPDGTQKGKLGVRAKSLLRRGIDSYLDEKQHVAHLSSAVQYEQRNTTGFVKRWAFRRFREGSLTQSLIGALPTDRRLWRYGTNRTEMRRPNQLVLEYVESVLAHPDSGFDEAMAQVRRYADARRRREGLSRPQRRQLIITGRNRIVERAVNGVFAVLRQLPPDALSVTTPLLRLANADPVPAWNTPGVGGWITRLRLAGSRLSRHQRKAAQFAELAASWREAEISGEASSDSLPMVRLFDIEQEYHETCSAKYAGLLPLAAVLDESLRSSLGELNRLGNQLVALQTLRNDTSIRRLSDPAEAEHLGLSIYGQEGGWLLSNGDSASMAEFDRRVDRRRVKHHADTVELRQALSARGLRLLEAGGRFSVEPRSRAATVMAVDLHEARELWGRDDIPVRAWETFTAWARMRASALQDAERYLGASGQPEGLSNLDLRDDVAAMERVAAHGVAEKEPGAHEEGQPAVEPPVVRTVAVGARAPGENMVQAVRDAAQQAAAEVLSERDNAG